MAMTQENAAWFAETFARMVGNVGLALLGKEEVVRLALVTMLAEGHLLLEDAPGTGKTALARAVAATVQGTHSRIQFTPDLLPSDITGVGVPCGSGVRVGGAGGRDQPGESEDAVGPVGGDGGVAGDGGRGGSRGGSSVHGDRDAEPD